ncbi:hypothetical protein GHT09_017228 [Marmota monax]|uniref:Uncharacterized protein n=1 Tax=Marmota monax TaxID=9995 RepID=A0A834Q5U7_MARMO|nr:hypothetical protein GHT09_017228 [Marmota monax]
MGRPLGSKHTSPSLHSSHGAVGLAGSTYSNLESNQWWNGDHSCPGRESSLTIVGNNENKHMWTWCVSICVKRKLLLTVSKRINTWGGIRGQRGGIIFTL